MRLSRRSSGGRGANWLRLYPREWRDRYEAEMAAIIEARTPDRWAALDLARGALDAHMHPLTPASIPIVAATIAGLAWIVVGLASVLQPVGPDWPGFLLETLPIGLVAAVASFRTVVAVGRRSGIAAPRGTAAALVLAVVGHVAWITVLGLAVVGGPYGAITGAGQSIAAVGAVAVGLVRLRADDEPVAQIVIVAGAALLIPSPLGWLVAGAAWIALVLVALRPSVRTLGV